MTRKRGRARRAGGQEPRVRFETAAVHAGQHPEPVTGAVMTPVFLTSTFAQKAPGQHTGFEYSRTQNPTRFALEANLAALEGGAWGLAFNAGVAASTAVLSLLDAGDHVVAGDDLYGGIVPAVREGVPPPGRAFQLCRRARSQGGGRRHPAQHAAVLARDADQPAAQAWPTSARSPPSAPRAASACASTTPS